MALAPGVRGAGMNVLELPLSIMLSAAAGAGANTAPGGLFGWGAVDLPLLLLLPALLVASGLFSGSETALFGLSEAQRMRMRREPSLGTRAADALLAAPHMLLITILLANTAINVLYFVTTSVLLMRAQAAASTLAILALGFLLLIVLAGEVLPKALASAHRVRCATLVSPPLLTIHRAIAPLRIILGPGIIAPLSRLTAPARAPQRLDDAELRAFVEVSAEKGVIEVDEQRILRQVLALHNLRVRDVMTPRVQMLTVPSDAGRDDVLAAVRERAITIVPVYGRNVDDIVGMLHVKRHLLRDDPPPVTDPSVMDPAHFVPALVTLDQLLNDFRLRRLRSAIVVDEYGGTAGVVSVEDVVEEFVGELTDDDEDAAHIHIIGPATWTVSGSMSVRDWAEAFDVPLDAPKVATVGGLVTERLGRAPHPGDEVDIDHVRVRVESVHRRRVVRVAVLDQRGKPDEAGPADVPGDAGGAS